MLTQCKQCKRLYDDAHKWTICPHRPIGADPITGKGYCSRHDFFTPCSVCDVEKDHDHTIKFAE